MSVERMIGADGSVAYFDNGHTEPVYTADFRRAQTFLRYEGLASELAKVKSGRLRLQDCNGACQQALLDEAICATWPAVTP
jgi:hypothetical protein